MFKQELKDSLRETYQTSDYNLACDFYNPALSQAVLYQRVSAYFSLQSLALYSEGLDKLAQNNDCLVQFIISAEVSEEDFNTINYGYGLRNFLQQQIYTDEEIINFELQANLGDLAILIAKNKADIKIALIKSKKGIFHDKYGLISDENGETIFFTGSANESTGGLRDNYESISVDVSWDLSCRVNERIKNYQNRFKRLWNNEEVDVKTVLANKLVYDLVKKYSELAHASVSARLRDTGMEQQNITNEFKGYAIVKDNNDIRFKDLTADKISESDRCLQPGKQLDEFCDSKTKTFYPLNYAQLEKAIALIRQRAEHNKVEFFVAPDILEQIANCKYSINQYKTQGLSLKDSSDNRWEEEFGKFSQVVQNEVNRPLKELHLRVAFYQYMMQRAANFSVPGAGKTAMILGVFAYLNSNSAQSSELIKRMLVVCPVNAFNSWILEFNEVFGTKKKLEVIDTQKQKFDGDLRRHWHKSNLILVNYESLTKYEEQLLELVDDATMLIFDEVHRIKNPEGKRAKPALAIAKKAKSKFVLTGTPIPNSYVDIYNFLHILYDTEYPYYFGWSTGYLSHPNYVDKETINKKLTPFFWRINKKRLEVPPADSDIFIKKKPSAEQLNLASEIWIREKSPLVIFIRLIQISTNPELINDEINFNSLGFDDFDDFDLGITKKEFEKEISTGIARISKLPDSKKYTDLTEIKSPKFDAGIELVHKLISEDKKVLIWGVFVKTLEKICKTLQRSGINAKLICGKTPKDKRDELIKQFCDDKGVNVLISNPQTLGESISLHRTVHDAVYFEYDFNLTFMLQSRDRIHRLGLNPDQYTRYYYLQTVSNTKEPGFIDQKIYEKLKIKEKRMSAAIDSELLVPEITDNYLDEVRDIINEERRRTRL